MTSEERLQQLFFFSAYRVTLLWNNILQCCNENIMNVANRRYSTGWWNSVLVQAECIWGQPYALLWEPLRSVHSSSLLWL